MGVNKVKGVRLINSNENIGERTLEISHAERLLKMPQNGGWMLPKDSLYNLSADGLIKKSSNRNTEKPSKQATNK